MNPEGSKQQRPIIIQQVMSHSSDEFEANHEQYEDDFQGSTVSF
jgi:hypothetical protein